VPTDVHSIGRPAVARARAEIQHVAPGARPEPDTLAAIGLLQAGQGAGQALGSSAQLRHDRRPLGLGEGAGGQQLGVADDHGQRLPQLVSHRADQQFDVQACERGGAGHSGSSARVC